MSKFIKNTHFNNRLWSITKMWYLVNGFISLLNILWMYAESHIMHISLSNLLVHVHSDDHNVSKKGTKKLMEFWNSRIKNIYIFIYIYIYIYIYESTRTAIGLESSPQKPNYSAPSIITRFHISKSCLPKFL